ncbi:type II toxin-antitoxin system RelE/ParE family toxin [Scytonema hofmannii FACHB-248]|jgi:phage-related protein|uniref:Type II toxin-antitoxin system RelE/ParE family toxin n=1 Tax=Scytonema hofmannii FACHB-248 TaxID=1842502 RepID=A0ABR8GQX4_9CYAN|nr:MULTISPECIES: type II toxin-antitoxin system RelE/ParE family toxin [Nostocales]MBD2605852.1 type II toxin-antitoxin system RelE/ParE family toxin [Scytonema hofmannii FACHB-248]
MTEKRIPAKFYQNENGKEPVRDWLKNLDREERRLIGTDIKTVEFGFPIGMPICRPMGDGLFEVRTNLPQGIARVLFCIHEGEMVLLHGFIKKSQKTPKQELNLAKERKLEVKG